MKLPLSWINEYFENPLTVEEIETTLTNQGVEVDAIIEEAPPFTGIVVGEVLTCERHPNADKLSLTTVTDGNETYQVVCGAPNCRKGLKVAFAPIGAKLPDGEKTYKIKKTKIRDVESFGMLCCGKELQISEDNQGILELGDDLPLGTLIEDQYKDTVFELSVTPNLGHCLSVLGIARELAAGLKLPLIMKGTKVKQSLGSSIDEHISVTVEDTDRCPRYCSRLIKNVKMGPSPSWMQQKLISAGVRPINNIVDITNYVLIELGHPLHAFDYDKIEDKTIIVRPAKEGETLVTLDDIKRTFKEGDVLICDAKRPIAIGGVMGGADTEVSDQTVNVLLESAFFKPTNVRRTSKHLGLYTEGSKRFERGCDPNNAISAADRATELMEEFAGGEVAKGVIDISGQDFHPKVVHCRLSRINKILGTKLVMGEVEEIFNRLHLPSEWDGDDTFTVKAPTYRHDINQEIDLVEEVVRIYGYDNVELSEAKYQSSTLPHSRMISFEREVRNRLIAEGLQEFLTCDLISPTQAGYVPESVIPIDSRVQVMNPMSQEQSVLRPSLLPGLLGVAKYNIDHQNEDISGFEVGRIHFSAEGQYQEQSMLGVIMTGEKSPHRWDRPDGSCDFYDIKGKVENVLRAFNIQDVTYRKSDYPNFHPGRQAAIYSGNLKIGVIGEIQSKLQRKVDVPQRIYLSEINLNDLLSLRHDVGKMQSISILPGSDRDWTVTVNDEVEVASILKSIESIPSKLLEKVSLRDIYSSEKLGKGRKNVTLRFFYRDPKKTLEQKRVDKEHERIQSQTKEALGSDLFAS